MLKVEHLEAWGFEHAVRGMRNPMNSWDKSDTIHDHVGDNDLALMKKLHNAGTEHRKYLRQIFVSMDITAPLYWWKEFDTYKIGTVANSCSTMHKIAAKKFELEDFSTEHLFESSKSRLQVLLDLLNIYRDSYLICKDKNEWWQIIQLLPTSYNQKRTVTMNYEVVLTIIKQRTGHKLDEWKTLIDELYTLPYIEEIMN